VTSPAPGAVLFDLDGLLVDSEPLWFEAERAVAVRLGAAWDAADQEELLGGSLDRTVTYLLDKAGRPQVAGRDEVGRWLLDEMTALILSRGLPFQPGARELLAEVARAGIPHALVTSSSRQIMNAALAATGMTFSVTVCAEDVRRTKPAPDPYLRAAAELGVPPPRCVALEDSPNGVAAALAAGSPVIAVPSVPLPPRPRLVVVRSLAAVSLMMLGDAVAGNFDGSGPAMTDKS
jgi:HAD superfamily hydrolase (TIGR01509 family)